MTLDQLNSALLQITNLVRDGKQTQVLLEKNCIEVQVLEENDHIEVATVFQSNLSGSVEVSITKTKIIPD